MATTANVTQIWLRIDQWLAANAPDALALLPPGAPPETIAAAERTLGFALPRDVAESLSVHDGTADVSLHDRGVFLSLEGILQQWDMLVDLWDDGDNDESAEPEGPIRKRWFTRGWLPVLATWTNDCACVDLDPPHGGTRGQVFAWLNSLGPTELLAPSFAALLEQFATELEAGKYRPALNAQGKPYLEYLA